MLLWLILGALLIGVIVYTVSYVITRSNLLDTIKAALENASTQAAKKALASQFKALVKEKKDNVVKLEVLVDKAEKLEVTINCTEVHSDVYNGMTLKHVV